MGNKCCCPSSQPPENQNTIKKYPSNQINVFVIGDEKVGKDSLISALCQKGENIGPQSEKTEKFVKYNERIIKFDRLKKGSPQLFQINYRQCLNEIHVLLYCVDLSNQQTITNFSNNFLENVFEFTKTKNHSFRLVVVGCKSEKAIFKKNEEDFLNKQCSDLHFPYYSVSSVKQTKIDDVLKEILKYKEKNLTTNTIDEQRSNIQSSRFMGANNSLRKEGGSNMSNQKSQSMHSQANPPNKNKASQLNNRVEDDEESKIESRGRTQIQSQTQYQSQFIRIIPHEKMLHKSRIQLDKGNFGVVYRIELDGEVCALKLCKIEMNDDTAMNRFQIIFQEAENMQRFMLNRNMRIMPLKGISFQVDMKKQHVSIGYWMPLCKYSLKYLLKNSFNQITLKQKICWSLQIIESLEVFDKEKIQHMDLKPQNILLDQNDDIIVSDLSMSKVFEEKQTEAFNMLGTTAKYAHPAAIINHELSPRFDIYSFGVILLELFTGKQPWGQVRREELKDIYMQILDQPEKMNPLRYHKENFPADMKYIEGKCQPIADIIYMCCVTIFIKDKKDDVTIDKIKMKFLELQDILIPNA